LPKKEKHYMKKRKKSKNKTEKKYSHAVLVSPIGVRDPQTEPSEKFHRAYLGD